MDTDKELATLWKLTDNGTHEAWNKRVVRQHGRWRFNGSLVHPQHALDLVRASVERWLVRQVRGSEFWYRQLGSDDSWVYVFDNYPAKTFTLPEALKYMMENK